MASDITLLNMIMLDEEVSKDKAFMVGQVHDAMLWQVREDYVDPLYHKIKEVAEKKVPEYLAKVFGVKLDLPLVIDVSVSEKGWGLGEEI
jgi:DNA polymerase I-like protein with 3'-5' exonuclease and polymerase domains